MEPFITIEDVEALFRELSTEEKNKAEKLLSVVSDCLRQEAFKVNKNLDDMIKDGSLLENVVKSVCVDVIARNLMTSTNSEPMEQMSQSAMGYSVSGTFLVPGGGLFIKKSELARLGLKRQRMSTFEMYEYDN